MGVAVPLGQIGRKVLDEIEAGVRAARVVVEAGLTHERLASVEVVIPFATADGSPAPPTTLSADGSARPLSEVLKWLSTLTVPAFAAVPDLAKAPPAARGRLVLRVDYNIQNPAP